jgi:hypothetical protein
MRTTPLPVSLSLLDAAPIFNDLKTGHEGMAMHKAQSNVSLRKSWQKSCWPRPMAGDHPGFKVDEACDFKSKISSADEAIE